MVQSATELSKITPMKDFLRESLRKADELDVVFHQMREQILAQLCALELAEDDTFRDEAKTLAEDVRKGDVPTGITLDEFRERYGIT